MPAKDEGHEDSLEYTHSALRITARSDPDTEEDPIFAITCPTMVSSTSTVLSNPIAPIFLLLDGEPRGKMRPVLK